MLIICEESLPEAYLVVLAPDSRPRPEAALARCLAQAAHSNRPAVWVDCRLLDTMSATAGRLLRHLHHCLRQRQAQLVLCHVSEALAGCLRAAGALPTAGFAVATGLDEAAHGRLLAR